MLANPGTRAYNALSVILQYPGARGYQCSMSTGKMFYPIPNVDGVVVGSKKGIRTIHPEHQERLIPASSKSFRQNGKPLVSNLHEGYGIEKREIESFLVGQDIHPMIRAERISVASQRIVEGLAP